MVFLSIEESRSARYRWVFDFVKGRAFALTTAVGLA
jgi:hypothetical protein